MVPMNTLGKRRCAACLLAAFSVLVLTAGFIVNLWNVVDSNVFAAFQRDSESTLIGRLVLSRQNGIFSFGGLTGRGGSPGWGGIDYQFKAYTRGLTFTSYTPYVSQIGGQAMLFGVMDAVLPVSPSLRLRLYQLLTSTLAAIALTAFVLWFYSVFGKLVALSVLGSTVFAQWLVPFGRSLWWSIWAFFVPVIVVGVYVMRSRRPRGIRYLTLGVLAGASLLVKCFINGYEYITPTLVMMILPLIYHMVVEKAGVRSLVKATAVALLGASIGIVISLAILAFQIGSLGGGIPAAVMEIRTSLLKRTYGNPSELDPAFTPSLEAGLPYVLGRYLQGIFFDPGAYASSALHIIRPTSIPIRYDGLILALVAASCLVLWRTRKLPPGEIRQTRIALIVVASCSIVAPMSWFVIFKAHAAAHFHIDFIVWQMPFTLFVFAVIGLLFRDMWDSLADRLKRWRAPAGAPYLGNQ